LIRLTLIGFILNTPASCDLQAIVKDNPNFIFKYLRWPINSFWTLGRLSLEMILRRPDVLFRSCAYTPFV
jgi:hypothetical protein